jgi:hypothetical protein
MADFNLEEAQKFQTRMIESVKDIERGLDRDVLKYYTDDTVDDEKDYYENLRGLHDFMRVAYRRLGDLLTEIERRQNG